ncbi:hypothetical protein HK102_011108, partial [Quaeritorhiza haematococci]
VTAHPKILREILKTDWESYTRGVDSAFHFFDALAGGITLQPNGPQWREARTLFERFFTVASIRSGALPIMKEEIPVLFRVLDEKQRKAARQKENGGFDIQSVFQHITFDIITRVVFGRAVGALESDGSSYLDAFEYCMKDMMRRYVLRNLLPRPLLTGGPKFHTNITHFWSLVTDRLNDYDSKIRDNTYDPDPTDESILGTLLRERFRKTGGDGKEGIPDWMWEGENHVVFVKQLVSVLVAGHDTTTNLLAWVMHYLIEDEEVQERVYEEIVGACGPDRDVSGSISNDVAPGITLEKLESCKLLNAVIKETLRLRPSAPALPRMTAKPCNLSWTEEPLNGVGPKVEHSATIPKGQVVLYSTVVAHTHPLHWPDRSLEWVPDRWMPPTTTTTDETPNKPSVSPHLLGGATTPLAYIPFGYGPRKCLGERLALAEARVVIAAIVRRYRIRHPEGWKKPEIVETITMK